MVPIELEIITGALSALGTTGKEFTPDYNEDLCEPATTWIVDGKYSWTGLELDTELEETENPIKVPGMDVLVFVEDWGADSGDDDANVA